MTKTQQGQILVAAIVFIIAVCNVLGFDIPVIPTV